MNLRKATQHYLSEGFRTHECKPIIERTQAKVLAYIRLKIVSGHLYTKWEMLEYLTWDYIADLFERGHNDVFTVLRKVFGDVDLLRL